MKCAVVLASIIFCAVTTARAHPGPRVWLGSNGGTLATFTSNNDLAPGTFTTNRVFVGGVDEDTLTANGRLEEFPVPGTGIYASEYPGYQVRTDGNSGLSTGSNFGFELGPLLVFDGGTFKPAWQVYSTSTPRMNESISTSSLTTSTSVQTGFNFFSYNTPSDHAHLTTTLLGNGTQAIDGPHTVYAVPMQLTGGGKATSLPYYVLFGRTLGVGDATFDTARSTLQSIVGASTGTWIVDVNEDWSRAGNWLAIDPNAAGATAIFGGAATAPRTITLNVSRTLGQIRFDNVNRYTIAGTGTLVLAGGGTIDAISGSHTIDVPISTAGPITKIGVGTVTVRNVRAGNVSVNAGGISIRAGGGPDGTSKVQLLAITAGASLDLADNDLIVGAGTTKAQVQSLITSVRLRSSFASQSTTLGVLSGAQFNQVGGGGVFSGQSYVATDTLVKYTWFGDADFNGIVNFDDYARIDAGFNSAGDEWFEGDFDLNGIVNFDDYALIDLAFNTQGGTLRSPVPEPGQLLPTSIVTCATLVRRARRS